MALSKGMQVLLLSLGFTIGSLFLLNNMYQWQRPHVVCPACQGLTVQDLRRILTSQKNGSEKFEQNNRVFDTDGRKSFHNKIIHLDQKMAGLVGSHVKADDPRVIEVLQTYVIDPPSPYMSKMSMDLFKTTQAEVVDKLLEEKTNGFFVECGALDGERSSNSIFFEKKRDWTGLLVEMDPSYYLQLLGKNRKAYSLNACISPFDYPVKMDIKEDKRGRGRLAEGYHLGQTNRQSYCFPFYSMMLALNRTYIDYFSLDVEGFELEILKTIPFDMIDIPIFTVEHRYSQRHIEEKTYVDFMVSKGYYKHSRIKKKNPSVYFSADDLVFVKQGFRA